LDGVTIQAGQNAVLIDDYANSPSTRLIDITLKNVAIQAANGQGVIAGGVTGLGPQRLVLDNVTATSTSNGFNLQNSLDSLVMNSRVTGTTVSGSRALFVNGGQRNVFVNNIFGSPPAGTGITVNGTGVSFLNSPANRFELNTVQGHATDGVAFFNQNIGDQTLQASDNYAGKNSVISNGFAALNAGDTTRSNGTGIWVNCGANNSSLFGNDAQGGPEAALTAWSSKSNLFLGNLAHDNKDAGMFVSGGSDVYPFARQPRTGSNPPTTRCRATPSSTTRSTASSCATRTSRIS
jgi:hypothetical protein